jgi:hypothetical protein
MTLYYAGVSNQKDEPITSGLTVIRPRLVDSMRHTVADLSIHIRVDPSRRFSELAVFDARLYIRVRRVDEPA